MDKINRSVYKFEDFVENFHLNVDIRKNSHEYLIKIRESYQQFFFKTSEKSLGYPHFYVHRTPEKS